MDGINPFPESPVVPETFGDDRSLQFRCTKGISCWNACCSSIDIALTPYDVVRLKARLDLDSATFLRDYTVPYEMEKDGMPGVKLKPVEGGTACRFMGPEGCAVYSDRPTACRYYPIALLSMRKQGEPTDSNSYALVKEPHCRGHEQPCYQTVGEYRRGQGLDEYDEAARGWRQLVLKKKSSGPTIGKPSKRSLELFFMACYDIDRFRLFVSSEAFAGFYEVPDEELLQVVSDDKALMLFAFRFLRQVLFGEMTIPVREEAVQARAARVRERALQLEREAAERMAAQEDGE